MDAQQKAPNLGAYQTINPSTILRAIEVRTLLGVSRSTLWRLWQRGDFPRPRKISARVVGWPAGEVYAWLESRTQVGSGPQQTSSTEAFAPESRRAMRVDR
jgi:prophage regulatory protein